MNIGNLNATIMTARLSTMTIAEQIRFLTETARDGLAATAPEICESGRFIKSLHSFTRIGDSA